MAGGPLTASSSLLDEQPARGLRRLGAPAAQGMILLGHLHTHEFAVGGTTDQVGNPWALERSAGGSSGGSAAALAARMVPAATGTDTAGSLRIPSALCGTSTIKPTRGLVSMRGVVPLATSLDHAGADGAHAGGLRAAARRMAGPDRRPQRAAAGAGRAAARRRARAARGRAPGAVAARPDWSSSTTDTAEASTARSSVCRRLGASLVDRPPPEVRAGRGRRLLRRARAPSCSPTTAASTAGATATARRSASGPSRRGARGLGRAVPRRAERRRETTAGRLGVARGTSGSTALVEPTVPCDAPLRGAMATTHAAATPR